MTIEDNFINWFDQSLNNISNKYYSSRNWMNGPEFVIKNIKLDEVTNKTYQLKSEKNYERVFCYELYHQLRKTMDEYCFEDEVILQAELRKEQISPSLLEKFEEKFKNIKSLDGVYYPDFILHQPTSFDKQSLIVEVKTNPQPNIKDIERDILKITHFIENYQYKKGIFLAVNMSEHHKKIICENIAQSSCLKHAVKNTSSQIILLFKESREKKLDSFSLKSLIDLEYNTD